LCVYKNSALSRYINQ